MNNWTGCGNVARSPEMRTTQGGATVANITVACKRKMKDKQSGEYKSDFVNCVAFGKTAEYIGNYIGKGDLVAVTGEWQNRSYQAQDGSTRYVWEVMVDNVSRLKSAAAKAVSEPEDSTFPAGFVEVEDGEIEGLPF